MRWGQRAEVGPAGGDGEGRGDRPHHGHHADCERAIEQGAPDAAGQGNDRHALGCDRDGPTCCVALAALDGEGDELGLPGSPHSPARSPFDVA